jgi:hypothetical protein
MFRPLSVFAFLAALIFSSSALAAPIIVTHTATGTISGSTNGNAFGASTVIFTGYGDTTSRDTIGPNVFDIDHTSATVEIVGVGTYNFITPTRTFVNNQTVGFSRSSGADLLNGPSDALLGPWEMLTSVGPVSGSGNFLQWTLSDMDTDGGVLVFGGRPTSIEFQAVVGGNVPAPAAMSLFGFGLFSLGVVRRRRARH